MSSADYYADDETPDHDKRQESTRKVAYPFLKNSEDAAGGGRGDGSRPNTASQSKFPDDVCDEFQEMKIGNTVKKRGGDDQENSMFMESEIVGDRFGSHVGKVAAATLHVMGAENLEGSAGIKPSSKRQRIHQAKVEVASSDSHMRNLIPCQVAPKRDQLEFQDVYMEAVCDKWGVFEYLAKDDPRVNELYNSNKGKCDSDLHLRYAILSTSILTDDQRTEMSSAKAIEEYSVLEILSIWLAPDEFINTSCGGDLDRRRNAFLSKHPYPIGREGRVPLAGRREKLLKFYKHPNVILAMYLYQVIEAFNENRLQAFQSAVGLQAHGFHWVILGDTGAAREDAAIPSVDGKIIGMVKLAGFANAVICDYHHIISDDLGDYYVDGVWHSLGIDYMGGTRCTTNHRKCFKQEILIAGKVRADKCIALKEHLACSDAKVNVGNNEKCNGKSVTIISEHPKHARVLHSLCTCDKAEGNFSGTDCNFVHFRHLFSDASIIEKIAPNPDASDGLLYNYVSNNSSSQDTHNDFESLPNLDETRSKVRSLMGLPSNDDEAMFNDNPEYVIFPFMEGYSSAFVDFETTSLDVNHCHILELAVLSLHEECIYSDYINPGVHYPNFQISRQAFVKHGISKMRLAGKIGSKDGLDRMFGHLTSICGEDTNLCLFGHNIQNFDLQVLGEEAKRHNLGDRLKGIYFVDTLKVVKDKNLWKEHALGCPSSFSLGYLYNYLFGRDIPDQHSAVGDVLANAKILQSLDPDLSFSSKYIKQLNFK
eukprot:scaffold846_cov78-Skeletonema_dohrnii-CCMP3373.AAC.2